MAEKRSVRVSTPFQFPLPPKDASLEASRYFRDLELYIQSLILRLQLPPHTKGQNQFLRHDALTEKLTWQSIGTILGAGIASIDTYGGGYTVVVPATYIKATSIVICTAQDVNPSFVYTWCDSKIAGVSFTIGESGFPTGAIHSAYKVGWLVIDN